MIQVVCWKWTPRSGYRSHFGPEQVNTFYNMVERNLTVPHEVVCITDDWRSLNSGIRVVPLWKDYGDLDSPHGGLNPSCYRRLRAFSREMAEIIGERFISMDLDVVITSNFDHIVSRPEDFVIWGDVLRTTPYNGSMWMMTAGARQQVWDDFDPKTSPEKAHKAGFYGSDQAWISYKIPNEPQWSKKDGVYAWRTDFNDHGKHVLHKNACVVFFQGHTDPWTPRALRESPWIKDHYR